MPLWLWVILGVIAVLGVVAIYDLVQTQRAILRNFPIVGHLRYIFEKVGPELRQYIVTGNDEERPFSRDQRRWVYTSAKKENSYFGFGTDNDLEQSTGYIIIRHAAFPLTTPSAGQPGYDPLHLLPCAKVLGAKRGRARAFRPRSIINVSAMSYGSLSGAAVEAINRGVAIAGALQNTGEGGISDFHRKGGELIWQIGTGYFGCRDGAGRFSMERFLESIASAPVRAIEIKLSQGAKPGMGGLLPAAKVTPEIARIRGVPVGKDVVSPAAHAEFRDVSSMLDFIEQLAEATGLPVGIKSAVGESGFWHELARQMRQSGRAPDFITIDGGEGGTGAAPLVFADHVAMPWKLGFSEVYRALAEEGVHEDVVFIGSGKLGFPENALLALAMGADLINVAREGMLAIGCIQAQQCHTGHCPTGVATQSKWLMRGLDPTNKSYRLANYLVAVRKDLLHLAHACAQVHPALVPLDAIDIIEGLVRRPAREVFGYQPSWGLPPDPDRTAIASIMSGREVVSPQAAAPGVAEGTAARAEQVANVAAGKAPGPP